MNFIKTEIDGVYIIERTPNFDERGYFARFFCEKEFKAAGIGTNFKQMNLCFNKLKGTLRGMHYQLDGYAEDKLVSCVRGRIYDVCVDIRPDSPTYCKYVACELSEDNGKMLYIPKGFAHGYVTLEDNCQLIYMMSEFYVPGSAAGYRYDDKAFSINWPITQDLIISDKDKNLPHIDNKEK